MKKYKCKHCQNIQYLPDTFLKKLLRAKCYVCGNPVPKSTFKDKVNETR